MHPDSEPGKPKLPLEFFEKLPKPGGRAPRHAEPSLDKPSEERLLERSVDGVERGLKGRVTSVRRNAERPPSTGQPQLYGHGREEHQRPRDRRKGELDAKVAGAQAQPAGATGDPVGDRVGGGERQQSEQDVRPHPRPAVWNTR